MKLSKVLSNISLGAANLYLASAVSAQNSLPDFLPASEVQKDLPSIISGVITWALWFAVVVAVIIIIVAGYLYITASGDEAKIKKATTTLTWAVIGLIVAFIAMILVRFVMTSFLDVDPGI